MKIPGIRDSVFPLVLLVFAGAATAVFPASMLEFARWAGAALLLAYALGAGKSLRSASPLVLVLIALYAAWCIASTIWSLVPDLTIAKATAAAVVLPAFLLGGVDWGARGRDGTFLRFLWPFAALAVVAAVLRRDVQIADEAAGVVLYEGAAGNPNLLGVLMAASTPVALWYLYRDWSFVRRRTLWLGLLSLYLVYLYLSNSRASYLMFGCVAGGFYVSLRPKAALPLLGGAVFLAIAVAVVAPEFAESLVDRNVYKYSEFEGESGIFANREREWAESYDAAVDGGWIGLGYGVSTGDSEFFGGYTAVGYGREKGNSQLAVIEETGVVGLVLLLAVMLAIFLELWSAFRICRDRNLRMQLGLLLGSFLGANAHGVFEAWWVSPGSVEFAYLWAVAGVGLGLAHSVRKRRTGPKRAFLDQPSRA
jgi:O-antigen ligase